MPRKPAAKPKAKRPAKKTAVRKQTKLPVRKGPVLTAPKTKPAAPRTQARLVPVVKPKPVPKRGPYDVDPRNLPKIPLRIGPLGAIDTRKGTFAEWAVELRARGLTACGILLPVGINFNSATDPHAMADFEVHALDLQPAMGYNAKAMRVTVKSRPHRLHNAFNAIVEHKARLLQPLGVQSITIPSALRDAVAHDFDDYVQEIAALGKLLHSIGIRLRVSNAMSNDYSLRTAQELADFAKKADVGTTFSFEHEWRINSTREGWASRVENARDTLPQDCLWVYTPFADGRDVPDQVRLDREQLPPLDPVLRALTDGKPRTLLVRGPQSHDGARAIMFRATHLP